MTITEKSKTPYKLNPEQRKKKSEQKRQLYNQNKLVYKKSKRKQYILHPENRKKKNERERQQYKKKKLLRDTKVQQEIEYRLDNSPLESFKITNSGINDELTKLITEWCQTELMDLYKTSIYDIVPGVNTARMNFQSPQPMRYFFSYHKQQKYNTDPGRYTFRKSTERRYVYGPTSVLESHGLHPKNFKV